MTKKVLKIQILIEFLNDKKVLKIPILIEFLNDKKVLKIQYLPHLKSFFFSFVCLFLSFFPNHLH
jgi:hypothetical protein